MDFDMGRPEIDKTLDLCYIRVAGLHCECKPAVLFDPPNFRPRTMTHVCMYMRIYVYEAVHCMFVCICIFCEVPPVLDVDRWLKIAHLGFPLSHIRTLVSFPAPLLPSILFWTSGIKWRAEVGLGTRLHIRMCVCVACLV